MAISLGPVRAKNRQIRNCITPEWGRCNFGEVLDYAAIIAAASMTFMRKRSGQLFFGLPKHRVRIADFEFSRCLDVERLNDTVDDQHRVAIRTQTHAARI
jgi:hypothetical protein